MASVDLKLSTAQKQLLSQQMLQSLQILQMSAAELESYIEDLALENPVIELAGQETHTDRTEQMELQRKLRTMSIIRASGTRKTRKTTGRTDGAPKRLLRIISGLSS